jgi:hypothetical protein
LLERKLSEEAVPFNDTVIFLKQRRLQLALFAKKIPMVEYEFWAYPRLPQLKRRKFDAW